MFLNSLADKDPVAKQAIQDKLHLLKLTSLDAPASDAVIETLLLVYKTYAKDFIF